MNRYFLKQHYKVKTRLLDWTENALVALYFAESEAFFDKEDAEIFILLPYMLNSYSITKLAKEPTKTAYMIFPSVDKFDKKNTLFSEQKDYA